MDYKEFEGATPGPWEIDKDKRGVLYTHDTGFKFHMCVIGTGDSTTMTGEEEVANLALIAAAPDLLKENQSLKLELQKLNDYISASEQFNATQSQSYRDTISKQKLEIQKQKELNAELVNALKDITKAMSFRGGFPHTTNVFESLIKKSS